MANKKKIFVKIMSISVLLVMVYCYCTLAVSAVSVDAWYTPLGEAFIQSTTLDNYYATNTPCTVAWITNLQSGEYTKNIVLQNPDQILADGCYVENGTYYQPKLYGSNMATADITVNDRDGTARYQIYDNFGAYTKAQFYGLGDNSLGLMGNDGEIEKELPYTTIHKAHLIGIKRRDIEPAGFFPYGIMLSGKNITLSPQAYEELYLSPVVWGSDNIHGNVGGETGIGGVLLMAVQPEMYQSATIRYEVKYTTSKGIQGTWKSANESVKDKYYSSEYETIRIPLISTEFMEAFSNEAVIYIDSVNTTFYSPYGYADNDYNVEFMYMIDSCSLTTSNDDWKTASRFDFDTELISEIKAHTLRNTKEQVSDDSWHGLTSWIGTAVGGFMDFEIAYGISIGGIFVVILGFGVVMAFMKFFAGG